MPPEYLVCSPSVYGHTPHLGQGAGKADKKITPPPPEKVAWKKFFPGKYFILQATLFFLQAVLFHSSPRCRRALRPFIPAAP